MMNKVQNVDRSIKPNITNDGNSLIDIRVIFDIYDEENDDIIRYVLGAFYAEASTFYRQLCMAVSNADSEEISHLFHSLKTMSSMIGARSLAKLSEELEVLLLGSAEFDDKYAAFQRLWPLIVTELKHYLDER
jgi:HPt (histidine-containing phosphotransfer) domain-containing protein